MSEKFKENPKIETDLISLRKATKYCDYSGDYLKLRARQGKLKAVKIGKMWATKKEWVQDYVREMEGYKESAKIETDLISLTKATKYCDYSGDYLKLRARQGKLKAVKIGRAWATKREWVEDYVREMEEYKENRWRQGEVKLDVKEREVEEIRPTRRISLFPEFKLKPAPALALTLILLLLFSGIALGKESLRNIFQNTISYIQEISQTINHVLKESKKSLASSLDSLNQSFINVAQVIKTADYEDLKKPIPLFKEYFKWLGDSLKTVFVQKPKALVRSILNYGRYIAKKIKKAFKTLVSKFQTKTKELKELIVKPWKIIPEKPPKPPEKPILVEVSREEFENLKQEIKRIKEEGLPVREVVKEIEVSRITKVQPIKEITKEIRVLDEKSLKIIKASLSKQETDLEKLKLAASLGYVNIIFPTALPLEGDTTIITLGTITTGTWEGTTIEDEYISNDLTLASTKAGSFSYSGTSSALTVSQLGTGAAALIDNLQMKTGTISTTAGALTLDSASGTVQLATGDSLTVPGTITVEGQLLATKAPTQAHTGTWSVGVGTWNADDATIYINPSTATADSNLLGLAVNGSVKFAIDAEGDIFGNNLILEGSTSTGATTIAGDLTVEGNTILGDASTDTLTFNASTLAIPNNLNIDSNTLFIDASGNMVGIGDTSPDYPLEILSTTTPQFTISHTDTTQYTTFGVDTNGDLTITPSGGDLILAGHFLPSADDQYDLGSSTVRWRDLYLGPSSLNIYSTTGADAEYFTIGYDATPTITFSSLADGTGTARNFNFTGGNVGIGTVSPGDALDIGTEGGGEKVLLISGSDATGGREGGELRLYTADDYDTTYNFYRIDAYDDDLRIARAGQAGDIFINQDGNVGIGDTTPIEGKLVVAGTIYATTQATGVNEAVLGGRTLTASTGLSGGGNLTADRSFSVVYGSTAGTAAQGNITFTGPGAGTGLTGGGGTIAVGAGGTFSTINAVGGTCITANADDIAVTGDCIADAQLLYNTGQHLTTSSSPTFGDLTLNTGGSTRIEMGPNAAAYVYIDFHGSATYTDYGARIIRDNTGDNAVLSIINNGTGGISIGSGGTTTINDPVSISGNLTVSGTISDPDTAYVTIADGLYVNTGTLYSEGPIEARGLINLRDSPTDYIYSSGGTRVRIADDLGVDGQAYFGGNADPGSWEVYANGEIYSTGVTRADGGFQVDGLWAINSANTQHRVTSGNSYSKYCLWNGSTYCIGMYSAQTYGGLNDYAMTFTMNADADRGWLWRDSSDAASDGAMSLTTGGILTVKSNTTIGGNLAVGGTFTSVGTTTKTTNLNADLLDGFDSSAFGDATAANQTTILNRIGLNTDAASMSSTLFAGQQAIYNRVDNTYSACFLANWHSRDGTSYSCSQAPCLSGWTKVGCNVKSQYCSAESTIRYTFVSASDTAGYHCVKPICCLPR